MLYGAKAAKEDADLNFEKMLNYAIEDEYLAREEYDIAIQTFGDEKPFNSIIGSEVMHISWLKKLLEKYGFKIPKDEARKYLEVPDSFKEAVQLGIDAEIENINMYDEFLTNSLSEDALNVFTKLRDASKGHLFVLKKRLEGIK